MELKKEHYKKLIEMAITEDIGSGDITSLATINQESNSKASLYVKNDGVLCGTQVFIDVFHYLNSGIEVFKNLKDGDLIKKGDYVLTLFGNTRDILLGERTALNFIQRMSGIATKTHNFIKLLKGNKTKILDTRKTIPGFRFIDKYSVKIGGGENHRYGLYDMILIKDNHIKASGSITSALNKAKKTYPDIKIEVEVFSLDDIKEALSTNIPDIIMFDNMNDEMIKKGLSLVNGKCKVEVSGNISTQRLGILSEMGVDYISIGALTHSVEAFDLSLKIN